MVGTPQRRNVGAQRAEELELVRAGAGIQHGLGVDQIVGHHPGRESVGDGFRGRGQQLVRLGDEFRDVGSQCHGFLAGLPFAEAAPTPLAQILFADRNAAKERGQELPDFRQLVEPEEQRLGRLMVVQPMVQLVLDRFGQPGDFPDAGVVHNLFGVPVCRCMFVAVTERVWHRLGKGVC